MRSPEPRTIGSAIAAAISRLGIGPKLKQYGAVELWPEVAGEQIARVAKAERMQGGTLIVHVENSAWRNELMFLKKELIERMNKRMNEAIVQDIVFR